MVAASSVRFNPAAAAYFPAPLAADTSIVVEDDAAFQLVSPEYLAVIVLRPAGSIGASVARMLPPLPPLRACGVPMATVAAPLTES